MTITVWAANGTYNGRALRQTNAVSLAGATAARPLGARSGVRAGTPTTTVTATATVWTVKPHAGVLDLEAAAEAGPYNYASDANVTGTVTAASVVRTDIVWVRLDDPAEGDGSATPGVVFGYTAGSSVTPPATPARAMVLAWINVPASGGGAPTVTFKAPLLAVGVTPGTTAAAFGSGAFIGQLIDDPALGLLRWNGTAWKANQDLVNAGTSATAMAGTAPPAGTHLTQKFFYGSVTTDASGQATITFPGGAFPNGVVGVQANLASGGVQSGFWVQPVLMALSAMDVRVVGVTGGNAAFIPSVSVTISAVITGW